MFRKRMWARGQDEVEFLAFIPPKGIDFIKLMKTAKKPQIQIYPVEKKTPPPP